MRLANRNRKGRVQRYPSLMPRTRTAELQMSPQMLGQPNSTNATRLFLWSLSIQCRKYNLNEAYYTQSINHLVLAGLISLLTVLWNGWGNSSRVQRLHVLYARSSEIWQNHTSPSLMPVTFSTKSITSPWSLLNHCQNHEKKSLLAKPQWRSHSQNIESAWVLQNKRTQSPWEYLLITTILKGIKYPQSLKPSTSIPRDIPRPCLASNHWLLSS